MHKIEQSGGFLGRLSEPLLKFGFPLMNDVLLPKKVKIQSKLTVAASATDAAIHQKMFWSGNTILIILNEEMNGIMEIVKSLEKSGLLIKSVSQTIKSETKEQKEGLLEMLLGPLGASLLEKLLKGKGTITAGDGTVRTGQDF